MKKEQRLITASNLEIQVAEESSKRKILARYVADNMKEGTDFYSLRIGGRETKPSLSKPGSEKVLSLFHWRAEFTKDDETWEMLGRPSGVLCYLCKLYTIKDSVLVGEGRGARDSKKDGNDVNKAIKMAEKSAQIDAVMRTGGLSDLFTQDLEDMVEEKTQPPQPVSYKVERVMPNEDDEAGSKQFLSEDEIQEVQKQKIRELMKKRGVIPTPLAVKKLTDMLLKAENYEKIIHVLESKGAVDDFDKDMDEALGEEI